MSTERALQAALAAARRHGIRCSDPVVIRDLTNVLVHLVPSPIVARVPMTLSRLRGRDWFAEEIRLVRFLVEAGAPVAPPAEAVDAGPHEQDGHLISFWAFVDHDPGRSEAVAAGNSLRDLHHALASYPHPLPSCDRLGEIAQLLDLLRPSAAATPADLSGLRALWDRLTREGPLEGRPLHGDSHFGNILWTPAGPLWNDLENTCSGPVEFDLACIAWRARTGTEHALAAYGRYDEELLARAQRYLVLFLAAWTLVIAARRPTEDTIAEVRRRVAYAREM